MSQIISIENNQVKIGTDDGKLVTVPIAAIGYPNPRVGDRVNVFRDKDNVVVMLDAPANNMGGNAGGTTININNAPLAANEKRVNKHVFVWVGNFLFGGLGVDRFMRGQVGLGVFKLLLGSWLSLGIWPLVDWIISITKCYSATCPGDEITFVNGKYPN